MSSDLLIDPEFHALIPPLQPEEYLALEESLKAEGCRDALVVWRGYIADGHNRYEICKANNIPFRTSELDLPTREDVLFWMLRNQLGRRNLTDFARGEMVIQFKAVIAAKAREQQGTRTDILANLPKSSPMDTRRELADMAGVSSRNIAKIEAIVRDAPAPIVEKARKGELSTHRAYEMTKALSNAPEPVQAVALKVAGDVPEKVDILKRLYASGIKDGSNGTFEEIARTGGFHHGRDMGEWLDVKEATLPEVQQALKTIGAQHSLIEFESRPHVSNNSGENEWYTPAYLLDAARQVFGAIDCDPASSLIAQRTVKAKTFYTIEDDGLQQTWHGNVWLNPPYAQPLIQDFCNKAVAEFQAGNAQNVILLVNNATETAWFQSLFQVAAAVCFLARRVRFLDTKGEPSGQPLQGQAVVFLSHDVAQVQSFRSAFQSLGHVVYVAAWQDSQ